MRDLLGRTGSEDEGEGREAGFTLIELMVVLLIMGILLAIAIPTFLSVTGGAKKTAAQSNLTNAYTSLQGVYSGNSGTLPQATPGPGATVTTVVKALQKTQTSIHFQTTTTAAKGGNTVSVAVVTGTTAVVMAAEDGSGYCWLILFNDTGTLATTTAAVPSGPKYAALATGIGTTTVKPSGTCTAAATYGNVTTTPGTTTTGWQTAWKTITTPKT
ncbi:MAG: type II secretion system protein [Acidimicrobiales bacterium]